MRGNTEESITHLRRRFEETVASTAAAHGCTAEVGGWVDICIAGHPNRPLTGILTGSQLAPDCLLCS